MVAIVLSAYCLDAIKVTLSNELAFYSHDINNEALENL